MLFSLIEASVIFQRHIIYVLREVLKKEVLVYLNDIFIISEKKKKYKRLIKRVYELLIKADLYKKKEKYKYFQNRVKFLSFILTERKIRKNSNKLKCI